MSADPKRVKEIFLAVSEAAEGRTALLERECAGDAELRGRVEALLQAHEDPASYLRQRPDGTADYPPILGARPGETFAGRFKLREELGHGGMGVVFVADQTEPVQRRVALKLIRNGADSARMLARFDQERQALALMDHPNIAKVFDAGVSDTGQPYFVMELIKGMPITEYCDKAKLTPRERLELFVPVCHAVQHAHQKGVIHRDLKPSNILVGLYDGKPVPKAIDFGVAKSVGQRLSAASVYTEVGSVIGTLEYMSPEQAELNNLDIDTRSDIYALGVILYQLLTGTVPFTREELQAGGFAEMLRIIKEKEPPRPSTRLSTSRELPSVADLRRTEPSKLSKLVQGELDWIVMKALEKDRSRRYETANGLAKDVQRYLKGDAVEACPPTVGYRLRKLYRKNRGAILTAASFAAVLLLAAGVSLAFGVLAKQSERRAIDQERIAAASAREAIESKAAAQRERDDAISAKDDLARVEYARSMQLADSFLREYKARATRTILDSTRPDLRGWEWHYLNRLCQSEHLYEIPNRRSQVEQSQLETMGYAKFSPDGKWIIICASIYDYSKKENFGSVRILDAVTKAERFTLNKLPKYRNAMLGSDDKLLVLHEDRIVVWDVAKKTESYQLHAGKDEKLFNGAFSQDNKRIVTSSIVKTKEGEKRLLAVWDTDTKKVISSAAALRVIPIGMSLSFTQNHEWIISVVDGDLPFERRFSERKALIWDAKTGAELLEVSDAGTTAKSLLLSASFSPKEHQPNEFRFVTTTGDSSAKVWTVKSDGDRLALVGEPVVLSGHGASGVSAQFSPDGTRIVTTGVNQAVRIWDARTGAQLRVLKSLESSIRSAFFSPDGQQIITASVNGAVKIWSSQPRDDDPYVLPETLAMDASFSPKDGKWVLTSGYAGTKLWNIESGKVRLNQPDNDAVFSPNGKLIATIGYGITNYEAKARIFNAETDELLQTLTFDGQSSRLYDPSFNLDGAKLLAATGDGTVILWDRKTEERFEFGERRPGGSAQAGFSPDGTRFFIENAGKADESFGRITIYDTQTRKPLVELDTSTIRPDAWWKGSFNPDGTKFVGYFSHMFASRMEWRVWDAKTGELLRTIPTHSSVFRLAFSPDGKRIITASLFHGTAEVWDPETGLELITIRDGTVRSASFSPDGTKILIASSNGIRIYDGAPLPEPKK